MELAPLAFSAGDDLLLAGLLAAALLLLVAAQFTRVPYPILLVLGGLRSGCVPPFPDVELDPELVLVGILPPLLYSAAFFTPLRELRRNLRADLPARGRPGAADDDRGRRRRPRSRSASAGPTSFVLGAIVSPTDPVAATAIAAGSACPGGSSRSSRARA